MSAPITFPFGEGGRLNAVTKEEMGQQWENSGTKMGQKWDKSGTNLGQKRDEILPFLCYTDTIPPWEKKKNCLFSASML